MQIGDTVGALLETFANRMDEFCTGTHIQQHGTGGTH
jgi:hypothetical protein